MKRIIATTAVAVSLAAVLFAGGTWWGHRPGAAPVSPHAATIYSCPMHPAYHSDHPGDCPICHMRLEPQRGGASGGGAPPGKPPPGLAEGRLGGPEAHG